MNLLSLLDRLGAVDAASAAAPRRQLLHQLGQAGARAAAAALPLAFALPAQAAPTDTSLDAVLFLLRLEDLLVAFYTQALAAPVLTGAAAVRPDFERLLLQQQNHAQFLRASLSTAGLAPPAVPVASSFDFSGRKNNPANLVLFPNVMTDYDAFLQLAQQLEDASADIYLGQAAVFTADRQMLDAVLRMQTVEARHASHIRTLRRTATNAVAVKSWPSTKDAAPNPALLVPSPTAGTAPVSIYTFEAKETQSVSSTSEVPFIAMLTGTTAVQYSALSEAFDEPLPTQQATALLNIFS